MFEKDVSNAKCKLGLFKKFVGKHGIDLDGITKAKLSYIGYFSIVQSPALNFG